MSKNVKENQRISSLYQSISNKEFQRKVRSYIKGIVGRDPVLEPNVTYLAMKTGVKSSLLRRLFDEYHLCDEQDLAAINFRPMNLDSLGDIVQMGLNIYL